MQKNIDCKIIVPCVLVIRYNNNAHYIICNFFKQTFSSCYETIMDHVERLGHTQQWHIAQFKSVNSNAFSFIHVHEKKNCSFFLITKILQIYDLTFNLLF
jgi:hypothetical protein